MAFPYYFSRNLDSARDLLSGMQSDAFKKRLEAERIGIAIDRSVAASAEGQCALDLVLRLVGRLYPRVILAALDTVSKANLTASARMLRELNPSIEIGDVVEDASCWLVLGASKLKTYAGRPVFYLGSDGWIAKLFTSGPVGSGRSSIPFGAGAAACIGAANLFRSVFSRELGEGRSDSELTWSTYDLSHSARRASNPASDAENLGEAHLVGAGAIGNGFLWAMARSPFKGLLHIVDHEKLASSNLQRYVMAVPDEEGRFKAGLGAYWLRDSQIDVVPHRLAWAEHLAAKRDWRIDRVFVAVDTPQARIDIQASLPRVIVNSWTRAGEIGVSRHDFLGDGACLACLYLSSGRTPNFDQVVTRALRLPDVEPEWRNVRERLERGVPTDRAFLERIAQAATIPLDRLLPFEGKPLRELYSEGICGGTILEFSSDAGRDRAEVPMAFQSALAGILLAAEWAATGVGRAPLQTVSQIDLLGKFPVQCAMPRQKDPSLNCLCRDRDYIAAFKAKYQADPKAGPRAGRQRGRAARKQ